MEDQQSGPGDLTDEAPDTGALPREREFADADIDGAEVDSAEDDDTSTADEATAEESAVAPAKRRRWLALVAGVCAALFVGSAAFAGAAVQPYLADRALAATKLEIVRTAVNAITTLWNYTPESMDTLADRASIYLSGDLQADYRKFIDAISATNKQAKVTDSTEVPPNGAAVESLDGSEATVIVYTNTTATSALTKTIPSLKYLSYRVFMRRDHARWLVFRMTTITSFDLTPKL